MTESYYFGSLTRIAGLRDRDFDVTPMARAEWEGGDYVVGEVESGSRALLRVELDDGRMAELVPGDLVVGALGRRAATLETVGSWTEIGPDGRMHALTSAGLFGWMTSHSEVVPAPTLCAYRGHVVLDGAKAAMDQFVDHRDAGPFDIPTVLIIGTSMSTGKTTAGKAIVRTLKRWGLTVAGAKLTGAGRYRDILALRDAGADVVYDFVDAGLPSSICSRARFDTALATMLGLIVSHAPDVLVAEAGASPREPYNGEAVVAGLADAVACVALAASDPYAVVGVTRAFDIVPDFVTGVATATTAGRALIRSLTGLPTINVLGPACSKELATILEPRLAARGTRLRVG